MFNRNVLKIENLIVKLELGFHPSIRENILHNRDNDL